MGHKENICLSYLDGSGISHAVQLQVEVQVEVEGETAYALPLPSQLPLLEKEALAVFVKKNEELEQRIRYLEGELTKRGALMETLILQNGELQKTVTSMFHAAMEKVPSGSQKG